MADAAAEAQPTHEQMIREMQNAGFKPQNAQPSHEDMIREMQSAGYVPGAAPAAEAPEGQQAFGGWGRTVGSVVGAVGGGIAGSALPVAGTIAGEAAGAGAGSAAGSIIEDKISNWLYGQNKSNADIAKDAAVGGAEDAALQVVGSGLVKGAAKVGGKIIEHLVPPTVISKMGEASDAVMSLWKNANGDIAAAADSVKGVIQKSLDGFRSDVNGQIAETLSKSTERIDPADIISKLEAAKGRVHGDLPGADGYRAQIDEWISSVNKMKDENGRIFVQDANDLKRGLQDAASAAYRNAGESAKGSDVANALKGAAAVARKTVDVAVPEVASANQQLATLHFIEDRMNKSLIRTGASESPLIAAGKGAEGSPRNARALKLLGDITGQDFLGKAQTLAAADTFGPTSLVKSVTSPSTAPAYLIKQGVKLQNAVPAALQEATSATAGQAAGTLGEAVMHGTGAIDQLKQIGGGQQ